MRLIKFWLSISEGEQKRRIEYRKNSPLTYWKFSENDENALSHYDRMSILKERVIDSDWHTIDFENKKRGIKICFPHYALASHNVPRGTILGMTDSAIGQDQATDLDIDWPRGRASSSATTIYFGGTWTGVTKFVRIA